MEDFRTLSVPAGACKFVQELYRELNKRKIPLKYVIEKSGVPAGTIYYWRNRSVPNIDNFEAALNAAGLELCIRERVQ